MDTFATRTFRTFRTARRAAGRLAVAAALAAPLAVSVAAPAEAAPTRTPPGAGARQAVEPDIAYLVGSTLHDTYVTVQMDRRVKRFVAVTDMRVRSISEGRRWVVVEQMNDRGDDVRISRYQEDGSRVTLARTNTTEVQVSDNGSRVAYGTEQPRDRSEVTVLNANNGRQVAQRTFTYARLLDVGNGQVVMDRLTPGRGTPSITVRWRYGRGDVDFLTRAAGIQADISADRLVVERRSNRTPYAASTRRLSDPQDVVANTGRNYAVAWNPAGHRLLQGLTGAAEQTGLVQVTVRRDPAGSVVSRLDGRRSDSDFTDAAWESNGRWITVEYDDGTARLLRCDLRSRCSPVSKSYPATTRLGYLTSPSIVLGS